jgi:hypothetical protein
MMQPLEITSEATHRLLSLSKLCVETVSVCLISEKIKTAAMHCFKGSTSAYLCLFGTLELSQSIVEKKMFEEEENTALHKVLNASKTYFPSHGGMLLGSGLCSLAEALHEFGVVNIGSIKGLMSSAANVLFLGANILSLKENIRLLHDLMTTDWTTTNIEKEELHWLKQSAFFGLVSNLGYIIATASLLYGGATPFTLVVAIFSCFSGGIKMVYDLSFWANEQGLM